MTGPKPYRNPNPLPNPNCIPNLNVDDYKNKEILNNLSTFHMYTQ